jgi:hypothetical protein
MLFTELCGFVFFRALSNDFYRLAEKLLLKSDLKPVYENLDFGPIAELVSKGTPNPKKTDIFGQMWLLFNDLVERLAEDQAWRSSFFQQSSRPQFMYQSDTRQRLLRTIEQLDKTCASRRLNMIWSEHFDAAKGIFKAVGQAVRSLN